MFVHSTERMLGLLAMKRRIVSNRPQLHHKKQLMIKGVKLFYGQTPIFGLLSITKLMHRTESIEPILFITAMLSNRTSKLSSYMHNDLARCISNSTELQVTYIGETKILGSDKYWKTCQFILGGSQVGRSEVFVPPSTWPDNFGFKKLAPVANWCHSGSLNYEYCHS